MSSDDVDQDFLRDESDEDFDLLTFNEARARLAEQIKTERARAASFRATSTSPEAGATSARLAALESALERTRTVRITTENAAEFFGHH
jgi:hypothetical protein